MSRLVILKRRRIGPQFKRVAALQGDFVFHGPRRFTLKNRADKQKSWGFSTFTQVEVGILHSRLVVSKRLKDVPFIGSVRLSLAFYP